MTNFMTRSIQYFLTIQAAREVRAEIEKAGLDTLKILCENNISIVGTYLNALPLEKREQWRQEFIRLGLIPEMVLNKVIGQIPELSSIIEKRPGYRKAELQKVEEFLKGEG